MSWEKVPINVEWRFADLAYTHTKIMSIDDQTIDDQKNVPFLQYYLKNVQFLR